MKKFNHVREISLKDIPTENIKGKRYYIVDDDIKFLDVISRKLINMGFSVATTNSGVNALSKIKKFKPDLIILNLVENISQIIVSHLLFLFVYFLYILINDLVGSNLD